LSPGSKFSNLMCAQVRLREVTTEDAGLLDLWQSPDYRGVFNDFSQPGAAATRERIEATGERGAMIVEVTEDGTPIGSVSWHSVRYGPNPESTVLNIGINLVPDARGRGYGGQAQRLLADFLFATTSVNRVEAMTDVENAAEQRALEKSGFVREGVLRGSQYRAGAWHDLVVYSVLRPPPPRIGRT
jgi:RimJ/RimL family protein N-acetyltransferase